MTDSPPPNLPEVYEELLKAFPEIAPGRVPGSGLAVPTLYAHLRDAHLQQHRDPWPISYVRLAVKQLAAKDIVQVQNQIFVFPTEQGENLITAVSGVLPEPQSPPPFPDDWASTVGTR